MSASGKEGGVSIVSGAKISTASEVDIGPVARRWGCFRGISGHGINFHMEHRAYIARFVGFGLQVSQGSYRMWLFYEA